MLDQWKMDAESEDHRARRDMTEKSITRYIKGETERQVTSSATASTVFVSDCTCIMDASAAQPSYLCCGLSNGSVCLLNTLNLSKIYLFEADRDGRAALRDGERRTAPPPQLVSVAAHAIVAAAGPASASPSSAAQLLLCVTLDGEVCVCPMDMASVLERKKVSRSDMAKVKAYPSLSASSSSSSSSAAAGAVLYSSVQFNARGNRISAVLAISHGGGGVAATTRYCVAVLSSADATVSLQSRFTCGREWHTLAPPTTQRGGPPTAPVELCYCGWWSADVLICVWSNSCVRLLHWADLGVIGEVRLLRHCEADAITNATVSRHSGTEDGDGATSNIVALVLQHNIAATFYVTSKKATVSGDASPLLKRTRGEASLTLSVSPTMQTYCTEDIPIREMHLFRSFSWTLLVLLESGALVFLDVETMKVSVHRAVNRLKAPDVDRYRCNSSLTLPRHFFCVVHGKPFTVAIVEHNAAILLKSQ